MKFSALSRSAQVYLLAVYALSGGLAAAQWSATGHAAAAWPWWLFAILTLCAAVAHSFPVSTPDRQAYHVSPPFFAAAVLLLEPVQVGLLFAVVNVAERLRRKRSWFAQVFNVCGFALSGSAARAVYDGLRSQDGAAVSISITDPRALGAAIAALAAFIVVNHTLVSLAIWLGNGISPRRQRILDRETLLTESLLHLMGIPLAYLALQAPWVVTLGAAPLLLVHRALDLPNMRAQRRQDALTQLYSAQYLSDACTRELSRADRFGRPLALMRLDIDGLAKINSAYGYPAGDSVIRDVAQLLDRATRSYDVAARIVGGEFGVLLPETRETEARAIAERLRRSIAAHRCEVASSLEPLAVTASVGVVTFDGKGGSAAQLLQAAESALSQAKRAGGDRLCFVDRLAGVVAQSAGPALVSVASDAAAAEAVPVAAQPAAAPGAQRAERADPTSPPTTYGSLIQSLIVTRPRACQIGVQAVVGIASLLVIARVAPAIPHVDPLTVLLLVGLAALADLRSLELFAGSTYAVSVVPHIAAGMLLGPAGAVVVAPISALVRGFHRRSRWYKILFNFNVYVLASAGAATIFRSTSSGLAAQNILALLVPAALAGLAYYLHSVPMATAMATELRARPLHVWLDQFRWLWPHYIVLSLMGLLLALAYHEFGIAGAAVFLVPPLMMHYVAKQYMSRTLDNVRQLRSLNEQLQTEIAQRQAAETENARLTETAARAAALEELNRLKSEFISIASHELRTPMTAIMGFSELLLEDTPTTDPSREALNIIHEEAVQLSALVDNLLNVSRIENGRITVDPTDVDLLDTVLPPLVHALGSSSPTHAIVTDIAPDARWVMADPSKLNQILTNLVGNAIKYSPDGGRVDVATRRIDGADLVEITVADHGIGIPDEHLDRIFDRFYRVDSSETRSIGGTGLGLYITRHLVELHGGTLAAESEIGRGSTFRFTLPAVPVPAGQLAGEPAVAPDPAASDASPAAAPTAATAAPAIALTPSLAS
ncbi:MAG TPA: diguanylate cyclase [Chloroflexota bacterium]|nr:diguanylate cyclase [Chloroflexota bacterium]